MAGIVGVGVSLHTAMCGQRAGYRFGKHTPESVQGVCALTFSPNAYCSDSATQPTGYKCGERGHVGEEGFCDPTMTFQCMWG